jgi:hypothetical protein
MKTKFYYVIKQKEMDLYLAERGWTRDPKYARKYNDELTALKEADKFFKIKNVGLTVKRGFYDIRLGGFTLDGADNSNNTNK